MRKYLVVIALGLLMVNQLGATIIPNPIISRGKTVYTSSGSAAYLVDNKYNTTSWTVKANSWVAINLGLGPTKVFFNWNDPAYHWANAMGSTNCTYSISFPTSYKILVSSNSTNGSDGDWSTVLSVSSNTVSARGHLIDFTGYSWIKMSILQGGGTLDEIEVFDASNGINDVWFFPGTSITANTFKGTPPAINFADRITSSYPSNNPVMIRGGIGCISSTDFVNNLTKYMTIAKNAKYWAIEMGTNDAWGGSNYNAATFKSNLQKVIDACKVNGIQPIIARVLATNKTNAGWQVHADFLKAVDELTVANNLIAGPDLYNWFLAHPEDLNSDGVHPNASGASNIQRLWAEKMSTLFEGGASTDVISATSDDFCIYPNPAKQGRFHIQMSNSFNNITVFIYDQRGTMVYHCSLTGIDTEINANLDYGYYVVKVVDDTHVYTQKLLVK